MTKPHAQPTKPYDNFSDKSCEDLTNNLFTTRHNLHDDYYIGDRDEVQLNHVDVVLTIRTGIKEPTFADVHGVHITNKACAVIAEKTDLSGLSEDEVTQVAIDLIEALPERKYAVMIESFVRGNTNRHLITCTAKHAAAAICPAFDTVVNDIYNDMPADANDHIYNFVNDDIQSGDDVCFDMSKPNTHTLIYVEDANLETIKADVPYIKPEYMMMDTLDKQHTILCRTVFSSLMSGASDKVRANLIKHGLNVGFTLNISTDLAEPNIANVSEIHLYSNANMGLYSTRLLASSEMTNERLDKELADMIEDFTPKGFEIEIVSVRGGFTSRNRVRRNAKHLLQAVEDALMFLIGEYYKDLPAEQYMRLIKDIMANLASKGKPIAIEVEGNTYTVTAVTETDHYFDDAILKSLV